MPEIHIKVMYGELSDQQLDAIRVLSKDCVRRNGIDAWFEPKDDTTDEDITALCIAQNLVRIP